MNNKVLRVIIIIGFISIIVMQSCYGTVGLGTNVSMPANDSEGHVNTMTDAETAVNRIWASVKLILQVVSLAIVLGSGVKYIFTSADQKADIKRSLGILVIGAVIVFGTTLVIEFITGAAGDLLKLQ